MGKRGPAKTPTKILKMKGSWRAKARADEPEPSKKRPAHPRWMCQKARYVWKRLIPQLDEMGVLGECDRNVLARYCEMFVFWRESLEYVRENGDYIEIHDKSGAVVEIREVPQARRISRLNTDLLRIEKEFGLTASARASLAQPKTNDAENRGKDRFFAKRNSGA